MRDQIGFDGLLMSDDVSMQALAGTIGERARAVVDAGSDVILHCNGVMTEMTEVADAAPVLAGEALGRYNRCLDIARQAPRAVDPQAARDAIDNVERALHDSGEPTQALSG
jgi:beta-N-acetylhexosaminidase